MQNESPEGDISGIPDELRNHPLFKELQADHDQDAIKPADSDRIPSIEALVQKDEETRVRNTVEQIHETEPGHGLPISMNQPMPPEPDAFMHMPPPETRAVKPQKKSWFAKLMSFFRVRR